MSSNVPQGSENEPIVIDGRSEIFSVALLADGKHVVGGGRDGKLRRWCLEDGKEVGAAMDAGSTVFTIAVSRDGKVIVSGTMAGQVTVWDAETHSKVTEFNAHGEWVRAVDVSPDATKIATGSSDKTVCVWSLSTGEKLLGPLGHDNWVVVTKFSPDGCLIATATLDRYSVRVYDSQNGSLLVRFPVKVTAWRNHSLAWVGEGNLQLFALSHDGNILRIDVSAKTTLSQWRIHSSTPECMALASNGTFIAAIAGSSVSFWDTMTHEQIGTVIDYTHRIWSTAISSNYDLITGGDNGIILRALCGALPSHYLADSPSDERAANLAKTIQELCNQLVGSQRQAREERDEVIQSLRAQEESSSGNIARLEKTIQELRDKLAQSQSVANQEKDDLNETINSGRADLSALRIQLANARRKANGFNHTLEQMHLCRFLYAQGSIQGAAECLLEIVNTTDDNVRANKFIMDWLSDFTHRCITPLERVGDEASDADKRDEAIAAYSTALSLGPTIPNAIMFKWATLILKCESALEASSAATKFKVPTLVVYRVICDILERDGRFTEAVKCFRQMQRKLTEGAGVHDERAEWELDFKARCMKALEQNGDDAMDSASYEDAIAHYSTALSLDPLSAVLLTKRSKARAGIGSWEDSLQDANAAIKLNPSSLRGHQRKHAALLGARRYSEAINAYNDMLLVLEQSADPVTRESRQRYVSPLQTKVAIRSAVKQTQPDAPLVVINTKTGRLCDQLERMDEFEADSKFVELVASTTTRLDHPRIREVVQEYFRYATFSHTWEGAEPLFHDVLHGSVHKLAESPTVLKLVMFCTTVREAGFLWAWCDTCCINKADGSVLQESLTSMFQWYHQSSLTVIHLKGVLSNSDLGALERSLWNTRAWTLQEFFASRVIRFYTEDWKLYLPDEKVYNHKESPVIMAEMARATGTDVDVLLSLRPGSDNVRQKLCLAATRVATKLEDMAYSLFGIFDVSLSVTYGEGQQRAVGRLLQEVLTRSGDVTILAWTGKGSDYNSCLPAEILVYREPASPYVPSPIDDGKMDGLVMKLRTSLKTVDSAMMLYDRVVALPSPRLFSRRLSLSCIMFPLKSPLVPSGDTTQRVYHTTTSAFGAVEIKTTEDLSTLNNLVLVHPWLRCLLDPALPFEDDAEPSPVDGDGSGAPFTNSRPPSSHATSSSHHAPRLDKLTRALRLFARLRQPFGALLLVPLSHDEYKRVACDHPIVVQLLKDISPRYLAQKIQTLDVL